MNSIDIRLDADAFDNILRTDLPPHERPVLPDYGDLAIFVKPEGTVNGKAIAVITFTVSLKDGTRQRVQTVTTTALLESVAAAIKGWRESGRIR